MKKFLNNAFVKVALATSLAAGVQAGIDVLSDNKPIDGKVLGKAMAGGALAGLLYSIKSPLSALTGGVPTVGGGVKVGAGAGGDDAKKTNP